MRNQGGTILVLCLGKDINVTLKKDENLSDKSWGWSPSYPNKIKIGFL